jgi:hypothetical protein
MNLPKLLAVGALLTGPALSASLAEKASVGGVYILHSPHQGTCPELDWHVVVGVNGSLAGMISWDDMKSLARVSGTLRTQTRTFHLTATEVGGAGRIAIVDGTVSPDGQLVADVKGRDIACKNVIVPRYAPPPHHD